jgi:16S rRNA (cytosine967-C5)-methyltransferase
VASLFEAALAEKKLIKASLAESLASASRLVARVLAGQSLAMSADGVRDPAVQDLVYGTLREYGWGDAVLARLVRGALKDVEVRALLLCALRALRRDRAAAHTVVDQAVSACSRLGHGSAKGLVNAVLRNYLRRRDELEQEVGGEDVARYRHPRWWIDRLRRAYPDAWEAVLAAGNLHPPMSLRVNRRRMGRDAYVAQLTAAGIHAEPIGPDGVRLQRARPVRDLPGFAAGEVSVQDAGAQHAARLLDVADGMRVLDACAAPGGKSGHLLEVAAIDLLALEHDAARAARIEQNLQRLRLEAMVRVADAGDPPAWWDGTPFDRVLLDAPCTGSGVARRYPDIKWLRRDSDIAGFVAQQRRLLDALWRVLAPDGKLLYATCSVFPEENGLQIDDFLARHAQARRLPVALPRAGQLLPDATHDGFYYALLEKTAPH